MPLSRQSECRCVPISLCVLSMRN
ncbi:MAG TPA: hypothetical protein EYG03_12160 [Planctomycetes bacterium]|nr:hypothetical protein [Planctomycetota bacterium]